LQILDVSSKNVAQKMNKIQSFGIYCCRFSISIHPHLLSKNELHTCVFGSKLYHYKYEEVLRIFI